MSYQEPTIIVKGLIFNPQPDITAFEMAKIWQVTTLIAAGGFFSKAFDDYMTEHNLNRHFTKE